MRLKKQVIVKGLEEQIHRPPQRATNCESILPIRSASTVAFPPEAEIEASRSAVSHWSLLNASSPSLERATVAIPYIVNGSGSAITTSNLGDLRADITLSTAPEESLSDLGVSKGVRPSGSS
ncbi:hypothetical protein HOY80DRAFT_1001749 [Tuber brumale]|nr:hypothetical protein HOY80DRAFT_1001749 [Tuber brumale]